ncbi:hypothetical protein BVX99_03560 [bacterium F16]|nr:hypothetical protein BVX99_03560 [bacterium F16]
MAITRNCEESNMNKPWLEIKRWKDGVIKSPIGGGWIGLAIFDAFWVAISIPAMMWVPWGERLEGEFLFIAFLMPGVALLSTIFLIRSILRSLKFGTSHFHLETFPGQIGGYLKGTVKVSKKVMPDNGFRVTLKCIQTTSSRRSSSSSSSSTSTTILWDDAIQAKPLRTRGMETEVPIVFKLPSRYATSSVSLRDKHVSISWEMDVTAEISGIDYRSWYNVPVYKTEEIMAMNDVDADASGTIEASPQLNENELTTFLQGTRISVERRNNSLRIYFPMARHLGMAFCAGVFAAIFIGAGIAIVMDGSGVFGTIFALFGCIPGVIMLDILFSSSEINVNPRELRIRNRFFFLGSTKCIPISQVVRIKEVSNMSSQKSAFYKLKFSLLGKGHFLGGKYIKGGKLARCLISEIESAMCEVG